MPEVMRSGGSMLKITGDGGMQWSSVEFNFKKISLKPLVNSSQKANFKCNRSLFTVMTHYWPFLRTDIFRNMSPLLHDSIAGDSVAGRDR